MQLFSCRLISCCDIHGNHQTHTVHRLKHNIFMAFYEYCTKALNAARTTQKLRHSLKRIYYRKLYASSNRQLLRRNHALKIASARAKGYMRTFCKMILACWHSHRRKLKRINRWEYHVYDAFIDLLNFHCFPTRTHVPDTLEFAQIVRETGATNQTFSVVSLAPR